jgi:dynein heavy chain, axonemal
MPEDNKKDAAEEPPKKGKKEKGDGDDDAPVEIPVDARVQWFEERVCNGLRIKNDKWKKMVSNGENV